MGLSELEGGNTNVERERRRGRGRVEPKRCSCCCLRRLRQRTFTRLTGWSRTYPRSQVYTKPSIQTPFAPTVQPPLYLTHPVPHRPLTSLSFCPYHDVLTIGHNAGLSSILVPGSGEPNFDSAEADPFENKRARREREVKSLLDKVRFLYLSP